MPSEDLADYYPAWLGPDLLWDDFPWEAGVATSLGAFLESYTLHDSSWVGLFLDPDQNASAVAVVRWDTFWAEGRVPFPGSAVAEWPFLLIRFSGLRGIRFAGYGAQARDLSPRTISAARSEAIETGAHRSVFEDIFDGSVEVEHDPLVDLLCLERDRTPHALPGVREA